MLSLPHWSALPPTAHVGLFVATLLSTACTPVPSPPASGPEPVVVLVPPVVSAEQAAPPAPELWKVGSFLSLSGEDAAFGVATKEGIDLAVEEVNAGGGPKGRRMGVLYEDDKSNPQGAIEGVVDLINHEKVVAVLGEVASARSGAGAIVANKKMIPMITPSATHPEVTKVGPFIFRACFNDEVQGKGAAQFIVKESGKKRIGLLFVADDLYSSSLARTFKDEVTRLGGQIVVEQSFLRSETNLTAQLRAVRRQTPDVIYAPVYYTTMTLIARQAPPVGLRGDQFVGGDGWSASELLRDAGDALEGARFIDQWVADAPAPASRAFVASYQRRFQREPSSLAALGYDAVKLLADAMGRAREGTADAIRQALQDTRGFVGATGVIASMAPHGEPDKEIIVVRITGRRFQYQTSVHPSPAAP